MIQTKLNNKQLLLRFFFTNFASNLFYLLIFNLIKFTVTFLYARKISPYFWKRNCLHWKLRYETETEHAWAQHERPSVRARRPCLTLSLSLSQFRVRSLTLSARFHNLRQCKTGSSERVSFTLAKLASVFLLILISGRCHSTAPAWRHSAVVASSSSPSLSSCRSRDP